MSTDNTLNTSIGVFDELRDGVNSLIDKMESEHSKINKAFYEALTMEQRATFLQKTCWRCRSGYFTAFLKFQRPAETPKK